MNRYLPFLACGLLVAGNAGHAQTACPEATLWEPYSEVSASVRDVRTDFLPQVQKLTAVLSDAPVPAGMATGIAYAQAQLVARDSGRLHTRMFVYPDGLERDAALPAWLYTTATSRVDDGLELLAMYSEDQAAGYLGLFAWTCSPEFPCPNGDTARDWQWSRPLPELSCNITHVVDQSGHAQKQLYYANHSDRLDSGSPPLWKSAIYLCNYCDSAWDLAREHEYQPIEIAIGDLDVYYPNGNPADLTVIIHDGSFFTHSGSTVTPSVNFSGELTVPVSVSDGQVESGIYRLIIVVVPVNDAPSITG